MGAIRGLHHAQITIPPGAEDEARRFYCDLLGLPEIARPAALAGRGGGHPPRWVRLQVGAPEVHLGTEPGVDRAATKAHRAYAVTDLAAWRARLAAAGIATLDAIPLPGHDRREFRDPFGNRVELLEREGRDAGARCQKGRTL